jgi:hypothetical protein
MRRKTVIRSFTFGKPALSGSWLPSIRLIGLALPQ